jgi:hypothetical protein
MQRNSWLGWDRLGMIHERAARSAAIAEQLARLVDKLDPPPAEPE